MSENSTSPSQFKVRPAIKEDIPEMFQMQKEMAFETEGLQLNDSTLLRGLTLPFTLNNNNNNNNNNNIANFYIAEETQTHIIVGMLMTTQEWSEWRAGLIIWIQSVYIKPPYRRRGVFKILYQYIKNKVETDALYQGIRLYVERENTRAKKVYESMGMQVEHYDMMKWMKSHF